MSADGPAAQSVHDLIDPARAAALHAALDSPGRPPAAGEPLPAFWHQAWFWQVASTRDLAEDGHPPIGDGRPIPDLGLPQRMWASGRLVFHAPLVVGEVAAKRTVRESVTEKPGRSGLLGFVTLRHEIRQAGRLCVTEWQELVFREPARLRRAADPPAARNDAEDRRPLRFPEVLLFRYSALTFNGHRIHYDLDYCRDEGHAGLVVHGPLMAQRLVDAAEAALGPLVGFRFRATAALCHHEPAELCRAGRELWIAAADGRQCMIAEADPVG